MFSIFALSLFLKANDAESLHIETIRYEIFIGAVPTNIIFETTVVQQASLINVLSRLIETAL